MITDPVVQITPLVKEIHDYLIDVLVPRGIDVVLSFVNTGDDIEQLADRQTIKPLIILRFGSPTEDGRNGGIVSNRADSKVLTFNVTIVAASGFQVVQTMDALNMCLSGYQPAYASEIQLVGSVVSNPVRYTQAPLRYVQTCGFYLTIDPSPLP